LGVAEFGVVGFLYVLDILFTGRKWTQLAVRGAAPALTMLIQMAEPSIAVAIELVRLVAILKEANVGVQVILDVIS
jgi:hypothetical protein